MMLDDFFTLSEIKDGFTSMSRVEKLVKIMQSKSPHAERNYPEAAGQWSAVASVLAATRSMDCLYLFIKLNGLRYLNLWIQDAQRISHKDSVCAVEESLGILLESLEKLPRDEEHIKYSGIAVNIRKLCDHRNPSIQSRARALFGRWNGEAILAKVAHEKTETCDESPSHKGPAERSCSSNEDKTIDDAKPSDVKSSQTIGVKISGSLDIDNSKKLGDKEMLNSSLLDPGETDHCSNHINGSVPSETEHEVVDLKDTKQSESTIKLESVSGPCENLPHALDNKHTSSKESESSVCHAEASLSVSVRDSNEPIEEVTGDDNLLLPNSGLQAENKATCSDETANKLDDICDCEVEDAQQSTRKIGHETVKEVGNQYCNLEEGLVTCGQTTLSDSGNVNLIHGEEIKPNLSDDIRESVDGCIINLHNVDKSEACAGEESMGLCRKSDKPIRDFDLNEGFDSTDAVEIIDPPCNPISDPSMSRDSSHITTGTQNRLGSYLQRTLGLSGLSESIGVAFPQRTLDDHGKVSAKSSCCVSKRREDLLEFDLNVADNVIGIADDTILTDQIPACSSLLSCESSIEVSSRGPDRQKLDLNCPASDTEPSSDVVDTKALDCNLVDLPNPSSLSSSCGQSLKINFDLNESLSVEDEKIYSEPSNNGDFPNLGISSVGAPSRNKPVFVLMGSSVEIDESKVVISSSNFPCIQNENCPMPAVNCLSRPNFFMDMPVAVAVPPPSVDPGFLPKPSAASSSCCLAGSVSHVNKSICVPTGIASQIQPSLSLIDANQDREQVGSSNSSSHQNFNSVMAQRRKGRLESSGPGFNHYMDGQRSSLQYSNSNGPKRKEPNDGWQTRQINFTLQRIRR